MRCRHCGNELSIVFIDLGTAPPSNAYLESEDLRRPETWFPLRVLVCTECWLVQTEDYTAAEDLFSANYAYFSSYSDTWLAHAKKYVEMMLPRFQLDDRSYVIEVGANDGYLLQYFREHGVPCLGIEPTQSTANAAREKGLEIIDGFFGREMALDLAREGKHADLMVANNVLAHVPDINGFVSGFAELLKQDGVVTFEFPHLLQLVSNNQFDTIYHEHYSYLSLTSVLRILKKNGLTIFDVEELPTHGGSLRVFACKNTSDRFKPSNKVSDLLSREEDEGMITIEYYSGFQDKANKIKNDLLAFLLNAHRQNKKVIGYGAAAKGNTLLNYAGIRSDLIVCVADANPAKQGKFLPGNRIPVVKVEVIQQLHPDFVIIFPWNLKEEIMRDLSYIREWGGKFVLAVPEMMVI